MDEQRIEPTNGQVVAAAATVAAVAAGLVVGIGRSRDARNATPTTTELAARVARVEAAWEDVVRLEEAHAAAHAEAARLETARIKAALAQTERVAAKPVEVTPARASNPETADVGPAKAEIAKAAAAKAKAATIETARARAATARGIRSRLPRIGRKPAPVEEVSVRSAAADFAAAAAADVERAAERARRALERGGEKGIEVTRKAKTRAKRGGEETASITQAIAAQAAAAAVSGAERARGIGHSVADATKERVPRVTRRAETDIVPPLRGLALQAAATGADLWRTARNRADDVAHLDLETPAARAAQAVGAGSERARGASAAVAGKAGEFRGRATGASKKTAAATVGTTKDSGALLLWGGAAAGLVFYAIMDPALRERVGRTAQSASTQARELIRDFRGYDDEF